MYKTKNYHEIVKDILSHIVHGITKENYFYDNNIREYTLECIPENKQPTEIEIIGYLESKEYLFKNNQDFSFNKFNNTIVWIETPSALKPDHKSPFTILYKFDQVSGLSDINTGSVLRTIVEGISKEIESTYKQLEDVYNSGFLDTATGESLDHVVALLGLVRKGSTKSSGKVTFSKSTPPEELHDQDIFLYEKNRKSYKLKNENISRIVSVKGSKDGKKDYKFIENQDFIVEEGDNNLYFIDSGEKPDNNTEFYIEYLYFQKIRIPKGTIVSTDPNKTNRFIEFVTLEDTFLTRISGITTEDQMNLSIDMIPKSSNIRDEVWEVTTDIESVERGLNTNVNGGEITVMTKPPIGVEKVINRMKISGGSDKEDDTHLRNRAKKILDQKGKATIDSLRTAIEAVEGVRLEPVIVDVVDGIYGLVKVIVEGGKESEILEVIEKTRAAGIKVEFERPKVVNAEIELNLTLKKEMDMLERNQLIGQIQNTIKNFIGERSIGEPIIVNQIISLILSDESVYDVEKLDIFIERESDLPLQSTQKSTASNGENIILEFNEIMIVNNIYINLKVKSGRN